VVLGYLVAVGTALIVERLHRKYGDDLLTPLCRSGSDEDAEEHDPTRTFTTHALGGNSETHVPEGKPQHVTPAERAKPGMGLPVVAAAAPAPVAAGAAAVPAPARRKRTLMQRLANVSETALHDFIDIAVFLIIGAFLAALVRQFVTNEQIGIWSKN